MHGGKREGSGRKRGPSKRTLRLQSQLRKLVPDDKLIRLLWTLAKGERRRVYDPKTRKTYWIKDRGDSHAAGLLADRKWGRVPQPVQGGGDDTPPLRVRLVASTLGIPLDE